MPDQFDNAKIFTPNTVEVGNVEELEAVTVAKPDALERITRAEVDIQIATAHKYPRTQRGLKNILNEALTMATIDEETAASCFYKLPRGGKPIEGPSIRLAEIIASAWGNMNCGARIIADEGSFLVAQGVAHDLEKNVRVSTEVRRRITSKDGKRYSEDMVAVTANAACSIALRNAIFDVIPRSYINNIYGQCKQIAIGDASTLTERRSAALDYLHKMGLTDDRIYAALGKASADDIDLADLETIRGYITAIKTGEITVDTAFPPLEQPKPKVTGDADAFKKPDEKPAKKEAPKKEQAPAKKDPDPKPKPEPAKEPAPDETGEVATAQDITDAFEHFAKNYEYDKDAVLRIYAGVKNLAVVPSDLNDCLFSDFGRIESAICKELGMPV